MAERSAHLVDHVFPDVPVRQWRRARRDGVADGRSGAVVIVQRFGGALNLNVHFHALVLDGVFTHDGRALPSGGSPRER